MDPRSTFEFFDSELNSKLNNLRRQRSNLLDQVNELDAEIRKIRKLFEPKRMSAHDWWEEASETVSAPYERKTCGKRDKERSAQRPMHLLRAFRLGTVSYTHLTLPTICSV